MSNKKLVTIILSHERFDTMKTLKTLESKKFEGDYKILIDTEDKQKESYVAKYGDKVIIFDKKEMAEITDLMNNFQNWNVATLARNYALKWAKENGYEYVFMIDDDIRDFNFSYDDVNSKGIKRQSILDINNVVASLLEFLQCSDKIMAAGFVANGAFFGG